MKQYFDCVLHPGLSFRETPEGSVGLLGGGRPFLLLTSAGGKAEKDHLTPWLLAPCCVRPLKAVPRTWRRSWASTGPTWWPPRSWRRTAAGALAAFRAAARAAAPHLALPAPSDEELLPWLRAQGLSEEALEALQAADLTAELFAAEEDWSHEELGLAGGGHRAAAAAAEGL